MNTSATITRIQPASAPAEQLTLIDAPSPAERLAESRAHARFHLSRTTRERGLQHVAQIRRQLAEAKAVREASNVRRLPPRRPSTDAA